jgi:ADP-dependent NAD(P)H-hydrate dehydratase
MPAPELREARDVTEVSTGLLRSWPLPAAAGDKNSRGRVLVVGGSRQTPGAVLLAAEAALRTGAGKVQVVTVTSVAIALAVLLPECLVTPAPETEDGELGDGAAELVLERSEKVDAVLLGPGIMQPETGERLRRRVLPSLEHGVVLDALGLSGLRDDPDVSKDRSDRVGQVVLTPNAGEVHLALADEPDVPQDEGDASAYLARLTGMTVTSGSEVTWTVTADGRRWRDHSGPPGLAAAGSGDVKSGIITALLARGASPEQSGVWGSHLHALAGEALARQAGPVGFLARELAPQLPAILQSLSENQG